MNPGLSRDHTQKNEAGALRRPFGRRAFCLLPHGPSAGVVRSSFVVHHKVSGSNILRTGLLTNGRQLILRTLLLKFLVCFTKLLQCRYSYHTTHLSKIFRLSRTLAIFNQSINQSINQLVSQNPEHPGVVGVPRQSTDDSIRCDGRPSTPVLCNGQAMMTSTGPSIP